MKEADKVNYFIILFGFTVLMLCSKCEGFGKFNKEKNYEQTLQTRKELR